MLIPIVGPSYRSESPESNYRECVNMYVVMTAGPTKDGRSATALCPMSGLVELTDLVGNSCRMNKTYDGYTYIVCDDRVYKLSINPEARTVDSQELLGTIATSIGPVRSAQNPTQIILVDGTDTGYIITKATGVLTPIADNDFPAASFVVYCDSYFYTFIVGSAIQAVSAADDGTAWDAADRGTAESKPDNLVGLAVSKGEVWAIGEETVEVWYDAANLVGMPFSPRIGSEIDIGCSAAGSIVETNNLVIWMDSRRFIVQSQISDYVRDQSSGYELKIISDPALQAELSTYSVVSDAIAFSYNENGHLMYQITFPSENVTWVYDQLIGGWQKRLSYSPSLGTQIEHLAAFHSEVRTSSIVCGVGSGKIYLMSTSVFTDGDNQILRKFTTAPISKEGNLITVNMLRLRVGLKTVPLTGDGSDPHISMRYSLNGGHTWSTELSRSLGLTGVYASTIEWYIGDTGREWVFEFTIAEPIYFSIVEGVIDADLSED